MGDQRPWRCGQVLSRYSRLPFVLARRDERRRDVVGGDAGAEREHLAGIHAEYFADRRPPYAGRYESYFAGRGEHQGSGGAVGQEWLEADGEAESRARREVAAERLRSGRYAGGVYGIQAGGEA